MSLADAASKRYAPRPKNAYRRFIDNYKVSSQLRLTQATNVNNVPKFCNGRMRLWEFVLLHVFIAFNTFLVILIPLAYFLLIPAYLQYRVDLIGTRGNSVRIHRAAIGNMTTDTIHFTGDFRVDPLLFIPLYAGILPTKMDIQANDNSLVTVNIPETSFWINQEVILAFSGSITFADSQIGNTMRFIEKVTSQDGVDDLMVNIRLNAPLTAFGVQMYSGLPLKRDLSFGKIVADTKLVVESLNAPRNPNFYMVPVDTHNDAALRSTFNASEIFSLAGVSLYWDKLAFNMDDNSASINLGMAFENPTRLELAVINQAEYYITLEKTRMVRMAIQNLGVSSLLNKNFDVTLKFTFLDSKIVPDDVMAAIEKASKKFAETLDFEFGILGPVNVDKADFFSKITDKLDFVGHASDLIRLLPPDVLKVLNDPSSIAALLESAKSILGKSKISVATLADRMTADLGLNIPAIASIVPPKQINFPYESGMSIYGLNGVKAIDNKVSPVVIDRLGDGTFQIKVGATVLPQNSVAAADDLAASVNPILGFNPSPSRIGLKDLAFNSPGQPTFKWCQEFFGKRVLNFGLPPVNKTLIIGLALGASPKVANDVKQLIDVKNVDLKQLSDQPGFGVQGKVAVGYPVGAPELKIDVGYFTTTGTVEGGNMVQLELPAGLKFFPNNDVNFDARAILSRDSGVPAKVQKLANAILQDAAPVSYVGMTGLIFGESSSRNLVTFSKVKIDIGTDVVLQILGGMKGSAVGIALPAGIVKLEGGDLRVISSKQVSVEAQTLVTNPIKGVTISIGSLGLNARLNGNTLSGVKISPIAIGQGQSNLNINLDLEPTTGANGVAGQVASVVNDVVAKNVKSKAMVGASGFVLVPPGNSVAGTIDQFRNVNFDVPLAKIFGLLGSVGGNVGPNGPVDYSALIPNGDLMSKFNPAVGMVQAEAKPGAALNAGVDLGYTNPLPISATVNYFQISPTLNGKVVVDTAVSGISLQRNSGINYLISGNMQPRVVLGFKSKVEGLPDTFNRFATELLENGNLAVDVGVQDIYFGTSPLDRNDLLSDVKLDLSPFLKTMAPNFKGVATKIMQSSSSPDLPPIDINSILGTATVNVDIRQDKTIAAGGSATASLPVNAKIDIPFSSLGAVLNDRPAFDVSVNGLSIQTQPNSKLGQLKINSVTGVHDTEELASDIAVITSRVLHSQPIPGTVGGGSLVFGVSPTDSVDLFSKFNLRLEIDSIAKPLLSASTKSSFNSTGLVSALGVKISDISVVTKPAKTLSTSLSASFNNPFKISLTGLNYATASAGINGNNMVSIKSPGIGSLSPGSNSLQMGVDMTFSSADDAKKAVANFADELFMNFGNTRSIFTCSNAVFGFDQQSSFKFLSKAVLGLGSSTIFNRANLDMITHVAGPKLNTTSFLNMVKPTKLDVRFNPSDVIDSKVGAEISLPFPIKFDMPYLSFGAALNKNPMLKMSVNGMKISSQGVNSLELDAAVQLHDSPELEQSISEAVNFALKDLKNIPTVVGGGFLSFGVDNTPENVIDTFSLVLANLRMKDVVSIIDFSGSIPAVNTTEIFNSLHLTLKDLNAQVLPGRVVRSSVAVGFTSPLKVSVQGLGYVSASVGVDTNQILTMTSTGLNISPGTNNVALKTDVAFPAVQGTPEKLAAFVGNVMKNPGKTSEILFSNGISFGLDEAHSFKLLSKATVGIPSSDFINQQSINFALHAANGLDISKILGGVFLSKAHISTLPAGNMITSIAGGVKNISIDAQVSVGYAAVTPLFDNSPLLDLAVTSPLVIKTSENQLALDITTEMLFRNDDDIQKKLADFINNLLASSKNLPDTAGVSGIAFGSDRSAPNVIDTFSKISVSLPLAPYVEIAKNFTLGIVNSARGVLSSPPTGPLANVQLNITNVDLDVFDEQTLVSNAAANVMVPGIDLYVNIPYSFAGVSYNDGDFVMATVNNLILDKGKFTTQVLINMPENRAAAQSVMENVGNILFHRFKTTSDHVTLHSLGFGASKDTAIKALSKVAARVDLGPIIDSTIKAVNASRPVELLDIQAVADVRGVEVVTHMSVNAPFFKMLASVEAKCNYRKDGKGPLLTAAKVPIYIVNLPVITFTLVPDMNMETGTSAALAAAAGKLLTFEDFASDAILGFATFTGTNGKVFRNLDQAGFGAGELYMWNPIVLNLVPTWPFTLRNVFAMKLPIKGLLSFANSGVLHLDAGHIEIGVEIANKKVVSLVTEGNVVVKNSNEGANVGSNEKKFPRVAAFDVEMPLSDLNPVTIFKVIQSLIEGRGVLPDISMTQQGRVVPYFEPILKDLGKKGVIAELVPFIGTILGHIKIKVFGVDPLKVPVIGPILKSVEKKLIDYLQSHKPKSNAIGQIDNNVLGSNSTSLVMADSDVFKIISF